MIDEEEEEIEPTEELRHGAHSLVKLINNVTLCMAVVTACDNVVQAVHETGQASGGARRAAAAVAGLLDDDDVGGTVGMADRDPERGRARKTSPEGADERKQALVSGGSDDVDIETEKRAMLMPGER